MGLFNKNQNKETQTVSQRQKLEGRYVSARMNILWVVLFTVINLVLLVANSNTYFLFSAFIPYAIADLGMYICGKYPADFYESQFEAVDSSALVILLGVAAVICVLYLLCWLFSKKGRVGWIIVALVFFTLDTVLMLLFGLGADSIIDVLFHGWVIISLSMGIAAHFKLKKLPEEEPIAVSQCQVERVSTEDTISAELPQE